MPALQQQLAFAVQHEQRKGAMQQAGPCMAGALVEKSHRLVARVDANQLLGFRRNDLKPGLHGSHARDYRRRPRAAWRTALGRFPQGPPTALGVEALSARLPPARRVPNRLRAAPANAAQHRVGHARCRVTFRRLAGNRARPAGDVTGAAVREPRERRAEVRGNEMVWFEWGEADAPLVVMAHATGFHARCWDATVAALGKGYRVVAPDQRGHGRSGKSGPYEWREFGKDLAALLDLVEAHAAIGVGHSMGGHALVQAAAKRSHRIARLVLVDPVIMAPQAYADWNRDRPFETPEQHPVSRRRARFSSWEEMFERFKERLPFILIKGNRSTM